MRAIWILSATKHSIAVAPLSLSPFKDDLPSLFLLMSLPVYPLLLIVIRVSWKLSNALDTPQKNNQT